MACSFLPGLEGPPGGGEGGGGLVCLALAGGRKGAALALRPEGGLLLACWMGPRLYGQLPCAPSSPPVPTMPHPGIPSTGTLPIMYLMYGKGKLTTVPSRWF